MRRTAHLLLLALLLAACGGWRGGDRLMSRADSLMYARPDAALALLDSIPEADRARMSKGQRMRYELLRADAQNKNFVKFTTDSVLKAVVSYYDSHGTPNERMRANYLLGRAYVDMGEAPHAMECFLDAEEYADTSSQSCDYKTLCRIHSQKARLFYTQYLPESCLEELEKACRYALLDRDTLTFLSCVMQKSRAYLQLHETDSMLKICELVNKEFLNMGDSVQATRVMSPCVHIYIQRGELEKARQLIHDYSCIPESDTLTMGSLFSQKGEYFLALHEYDSAATNYRRLYELNSEMEHIVLGSHGLYKTYKELGVRDSAEKYMEIYCTANDSSNIFKSATIMQKMQSSYSYERNRHLSELKSEQLKTRNAVILGLTSVLILITVLLIHRIRKNQEKASFRLREENLRYVKALTDYEEAKKEVQMLKGNISGVTNLLKQKEQTEQDLLRQIASFHEDSCLPTEWEVNEQILSQEPIQRLHHYAATGKKLTNDEDIRSLLALVKKSLPSFLEEIDKRGNNLKMTQRLVCILVKLRFLPSEICVLLSISSSGLSNIRRRLMKRLFKEEGSPSVFDERIKSMRPMES